MFRRIGGHFGFKPTTFGIGFKSTAFKFYKPFTLTREYARFNRWDFDDSPKYFKSGLFTPILIAIGFSAGAFVVGAVAEYENRKGSYVQLKPNDFRKWLQDRLDRVKFDPQTVEFKYQKTWLETLKEKFNSLSTGEKTTLCIIGVNLVVFLAWQIPSMYGFMAKYFICGPYTSNLSLFASMFSHKTPLHLLFNMSALYSFGSWMIDSVMGQEQFLAFYTTAGVISTLSNRYRGYGSLGASGALFGLFGILSHFPEMRINILFIPNVPADQAFWGMMAFDAFNLFFTKASYLDHAAHLAGGLFGVLYYRFIKPNVWDNRYKWLREIGYIK
jgi:rhomboid-like protein